MGLWRPIPGLGDQIQGLSPNDAALNAADSAVPITKRPIESALNLGGISPTQIQKYRMNQPALPDQQQQTQAPPPGSVDWHQQRQQELVTQALQGIGRDAGQQQAAAEAEMAQGQQEHDQDMRHKEEEHALDIQLQQEKARMAAQQQQQQADLQAQQQQQDIRAGEQKIMQQDIAQAQKQPTAWGKLGIGGKIGRVADIAGMIALPGLEQRIPGSLGYEQRRAEQAQRDVEQMQKAVTEEEKAQQAKFSEPMLEAQAGNVLARLEQSGILPSDQRDDPQVATQALQTGVNQGLVSPQEQRIVLGQFEMGKMAPGVIGQRAGIYGMQTGENMAIDPQGNYVQVKNIPLERGPDGTLRLPQGVEMIGKPGSQQDSNFRAGAKMLDNFANSFNTLAKDNQDFWNDPKANVIVQSSLQDVNDSFTIGVGGVLQLKPGATLDAIKNRYQWGLITDPQKRNDAIKYVSDVWNLKDKAYPALIAMQGGQTRGQRMSGQQVNNLLAQFPTHAPDANSARYALSRAAFTFGDAQKQYGNLVRTPIYFPTGAGTQTQQDMEREARDPNFRAPIQGAEPAQPANPNVKPFQGKQYMYIGPPNDSKAWRDKNNWTPIQGLPQAPAPR